MRKFLKSFQYAIEGILYCARYERNFKIHLIAMLVVIGAGVWTGLAVTEWFIVILLCALVLAFEMLNTAIERVVDLVTETYHPLAKQAKDLAAGAVLVIAIGSAVIGLLIFLPKWF